MIDVHLRRLGTTSVERAENGRDFSVLRMAEEVPGTLWLPRAEQPCALVLLGHGGSRHKRDETVLKVVRSMAARGFAVASIDGPVHGARRTVPADPEATRLEFVATWKTGDGGTARMTADWSAVLTALSLQPELENLPVGYFGLSMGTAYGLPLLAADPRIRSAAIGMWGTNFPNSAQLASAARKVRSPVLFMHKRNDQFFTLDGALDLFDALATDDKRMLVSCGVHTEPTEEQITYAIRHLESSLFHTVR